MLCVALSSACIMQPVRNGRIIFSKGRLGRRGRLLLPLATKEVQILLSGPFLYIRVMNYCVYILYSQSKEGNWRNKFLWNLAVVS